MSFHEVDESESQSRSVTVLKQLAKQRDLERLEQENRKNVNSSSVIIDSKDNEMLDELFFFGDFAVPVRRDAPKKKWIDPESIKEGTLEEQIVKEYLEAKYYAFSDFSINLEEMILNPISAPQSNVLHTNDIEAYRFAFGDFNLGITEREFQRNSNVTRASQPRIQNYIFYSLIGHSSRIKCISLSPDEKFYVSSSAKDATIVMYDVNSGKEFLFFDGHEDTIIGAHFSNDGKQLATASRDNTLILWDTVIGKQTFVFEHERIVICCCFSHDGKYIVSGCQDKVCRVWSTKKGKELFAFKDHEGIITAVSYSPDGEHVVSASSDRTFRIWSTNGSSAATIVHHSSIIMSCMYNYDGNYIVSNDEKQLNVWDVKRSKLLLSLSVESLPNMSSALIDGKKRTWTVSAGCPGTFCFYVVAACSDRNVYIINPQTGDIIVSFFCKAVVYCLSCGPYHTLAFGDACGNVYVAKLR